MGLGEHRVPRSLNCPLKKYNMEPQSNPTKGFIPNANYETYRKAIENEDPWICANSMICLIKIVTYLLKKQLFSLEQAFLKDGGLRERMTKARIEKRNF